MKQNGWLWQLGGFGAVSLGGTLLHFWYSGTKTTLSALFSSVNESTWEHMKLFYFPMLLFALVQYGITGKQYGTFWCVKLTGTLLGLLSIPVLFYTLGGIFGPLPDFVNIGIFFAAAAVAFIFEARRLRADAPPCRYETSAFALFCLIAVVFWVFTLLPPHIPLFSDPITGLYGLQKP